MANRRIEHDPDPQLALARSGDADAFIALIRRYDHDVRALAFRLVGDRNAMDDVLQEAYLKAFRGLGSFGGRSTFRTWLYRIVYNACLDERRRRRGDDVPLDERTHGAAGELDAEAIARLDLAVALAALPVELRAVVLLVDAHGLDYAEVGEVLGVPVGTVASRLNRARSVLRDALALDREEIENP